MKAKISLGSGGIKGLIVKHVEKAVVALAVLFFFLLVWRSSKLGGNFDLQPDQLQTTSVEADKAIREPKKGPDENVPPWEEISKELRTPIPAWPYSVGKTWMHRLFPGETLRGQPVVFPIEELRGSTGFGGIAIKPTTPAGGVGAASPMGLSSPMGPSMPDAYASEYPGSGSGTMGAGGNVEGHRWVVVTGLLPYKKQWVEYGNVFRNAEIKDPRRDVPAYNDYDVQRAEVTPGVEPAEDAWQSLNVPKEFFTRTSSWGGSQPEIVHPKFIHRSGGVLPMVFPLPPLVSKTFDVEIAHEPEIPLTFEIERKIEEEEIDWDELAKDPEALAKARAKLRRSQAGGSYGPGGGMYGPDMYGPEMTQDYGGTSYDMEGGGMMPGYQMAGSGGYASAGPRRDIPEFQLFRFFDFSVQPGRYYQYRVRVRLANPNHEMPPQHLENDELAKQMFLQTDWSAATKVISVPLDSRVLAGPVSVPANVTSPPTAELGTVFFNAEDGEEVAEKFTIKRGVLMNFLGRTVKEEEKPASLYGGMEYGSEYMTGGSMDMYGPQPKQKPKKQEKKEEVKSVDYVTEMLVLDLDGGDSFPGTDRNLKGPGRALLMDPAGNLVLQQELIDQEEWIEFFPPEVKKKEVESPYGMEGSGGYMGAP